MALDTSEKKVYASEADRNFDRLRKSEKKESQIVHLNKMQLAMNKYLLKATKK
jgi:hypothetical protein